MKRFGFLKFKRGVIVASLSVGVAVSGNAMFPGLLAQEATPAAGLRGILGEIAPLGLLEDDFLTLGESWTDWSKGTAADVAKLYEAESSDVTGQRRTIASLRRKLNTMHKALGDPAYSPIFDSLATLHSRLSRRVDVAEAILDTLDVNPASEQQAQVRNAGQSVAQAVSALDKYLSGVRNGSPWLDYVNGKQLAGLASGETVELAVVTTAQARLADLGGISETQREFLGRPSFARLKSSLDDYLAAATATVPTVDQTVLRGTLAELVAALEAYEEHRSAEATDQVRGLFRKTREQAGDGGQRIADALTSHYFNYNFRVIASEAFLNRVVGYKHEDTGPVSDFILGARVSGTQWTNGTVGIDLKPDDKVARFDMQFQGTTQTSTQGVTDQATVFTSGYHTFLASKPITFDGDKFTTSPATINVNANNTTTGARTQVSGLPLFGGIADSYAVGEARRRRGESEAIAVQRLRDRLLPEFNQGVDTEFVGLNTDLDSKLIAKLKAADLFPTSRSNTSTESELLVSNRLMSESQIGGDNSTFTATTESGVAIHLHQTWLNNAFSKLPLAGRTLTEAELVQEVGKALGTLLGRDLNLAVEKKDGEEPDNTKFVFPEADVLRVRIENNQLILLLHTGLQPENGDAIPTQEISIPLLFSIHENNIVIEAGQVGVSPVEPVSQLVQIPRAGIVRAKIQKALPTRTADRVINLERKTGGPVVLAVTRIKPNSGWLSIVIE